MKCELCHQNDAQTVISHRDEQGKAHEMYVCKSCAEAEHTFEQERGINVTTLGAESSSLTDLSDLAHLPGLPKELAGQLGELFGDLSKKMSELGFSPDGDAPQNITCPTCGMTLHQAQESGELGCADCYQTFAQSLLPLISEQQQTTSYKGKPQVALGALSLEARKSHASLNEAVARKNKALTEKEREALCTADVQSLADSCHEVHLQEANLALRLTCVKTQISLMRNLPKFIFPSQMNPQQRHQHLKFLAQEIEFSLHAERMPLHSMNRILGSTYYGLDSERSKTEPDYALLRVFAEDDKTPIWIEVGTENHFVFSVVGDFLDFDKNLKMLEAVVRRFETDHACAFSPQFGYLTAQPFWVGTGLRIRSWLHVSGLSHFEYLRELNTTVEAANFLTEACDPENPPAGDLVIVFNRFTLGATTEQLVTMHRELLKRIAKEEMQARERLFKDEPFLFYDSLLRTQKVLKHALIVDAMEALDHLSLIRTGVTTGAITMPARIHPLEEHWFDHVLNEPFSFLFAEKVAQKLSLPPDVKAFPPWKMDALRAQWLHSFANFKITPKFMKRALCQ